MGANISACTQQPSVIENDDLPDYATKKRIILVSDNLPFYEVLVRAVADTGVVIVPVQYGPWTLEQLCKEIYMRAGPPEKQYCSVGLLDHGDSAKFCLLKSLDMNHDGAIELSEVKDNPQLQDFFKFLASYVKAPKMLSTKLNPDAWRYDIDSRIDLMACNVADTPAGMELIRYLEDLTKVNWAASTNKTGAGEGVTNGFDWVMETETHLGLESIHSHYFDEAKLKMWQHTCWGVSLGFVEVGDQGVAVKPQLKLGVQAANVNIGGGIGDVRDGLSVGVGANVSTSVKSSGRSFDEVIKNARGNTNCRPLDDGLNACLKWFNWSFDSLKKIAGCDFRQKSGVRFKLVGTTSVGVGVSGKACLGWADTKGYHMIGASGKVAAAAKVGGSGFAGLHQNGRQLKIVFSIGNAAFDVECIW